MDGQQGATPAEPAAPATGDGEDIQAQNLLADAVAAGKNDDPLGEGGLKALKAEREARQALEKRIGEFEAFQKSLGELVGGKPQDGKSELEVLTERLGKHESELATERSARWRAEVAHEHGFTPEQAAELRGTTREEIAAHAERLKALFPSTPTAPGTPRPDPSQGGQGGNGVNLDAQIAEAQKNGNVRLVLQLQNQKLANLKQ